MKKIYSTLVLSALTVGAFSQHQGNVLDGKPRGGIPRHNDATIRPATDTLGIGITTLAINTQPTFAPSGTIYNFGYTGGGYVYGVNVSTNNLNECAQGYAFFGGASVEGVVFLAIGKSAGPSHAAASSMNIRLYGWCATCGDFYTGGTPPTNEVPGPTGAPLASGSIAWDDIDTTFLTLNVVMFPSPVVVIDEFAVAAEYTAMKNTYSDTVGLACDAPNDAGSLDYAFHKIGSTWYVSNSIFGTPGDLDNNIALFPIIEDVTGIDGKEGFFQGLKLSNYPNPVQSNTTVSYELEKSSSKLTLNVHDISGKNVATYDLGAKAAGAYTFDYSAAGLESGNYLFMLQSDSGTLVKKFSVEK